jgi:hypothetical protein
MHVVSICIHMSSQTISLCEYLYSVLFIYDDLISDSISVAGAATVVAAENEHKPVDELEEQVQYCYAICYFKMLQQYWDSLLVAYASTIRYSLIIHHCFVTHTIRITHTCCVTTCTHTHTHSGQRESALYKVHG